MKRHTLPLFLACGLLLGACARGPRGVWHASHPNGDKPAIAMEIKGDGRQLTGAMFLLSPDKPDDFTSGKSYPITIKSSSEKEIHFTVEFLPHEPDDLVLRLDKPLDNPDFHAVLVSTDGRGAPIDLNFERVTAK